MRQAGRILPPYRQLRAKHDSILTLFQTPELAAQITLMPVELLEVDAAILFTDLVTPLGPMGCPYEYDPGPIFARPVRTRQDVERLRPLDPESDLPFVLEAVRLVRRGLPAQVPLIGYGGAPFTLAAWLVEGGTSKDFSRCRALLYSDPQTAHLLLDKLTEALIAFLQAQIRAGAQAVQLFDTSAGVLSREAFAQFALPYVQRVCAALAPLGVPRLYFALGVPHCLALLAQTGAEVLSLDWRTDLAEAHRCLGQGLVLQGNLDPCLLYSPPDAIVRQLRRLLETVRGRPHIFNLGHGLLPDVPFANVRLFIDTVHRFSQESP
jgi:uroporphyrinogen decarboxylase